jgi:hypothetical protein
MRLRERPSPKAATRRRTASPAPPIRSRPSADGFAARPAKPPAAAAMSTLRFPFARSSASSPTSSVPRPATYAIYRAAADDRMLPPHRAGDYGELSGTHRRGGRGSLRPHRGARPGEDRLQSHGLRGRRRTGRHADRRRAGLPPAARTGARGDQRHPLAGRRSPMQPAPGPRFYDCQPARRRLQRHLPGHRPAQGPQACRCPAARPGA